MDDVLGHRQYLENSRWPGRSGAPEGKVSGKYTKDAVRTAALRDDNVNRGSKDERFFWRSAFDAREWNVLLE